MIHQLFSKEKLKMNTLDNFFNFFLNVNKVFGDISSLSLKFFKENDL